MFKHIMVPLDGSQQAEQALPIAARIARASKGSLLLANVVTTTVEPGLYPDKYTLEQQEVRLQADHDAATYYLTDVTYKDELAGLSVEVEVLSGDAAERILSLVVSESVDLIVMCRHGATASEHWTLGRTVQKVARHSSVPVLLISSNEATSVQFPKPGPVSALIGLDGSPPAEEVLVPAANLVTALSESEPGALYLVHVVVPNGEGKYGRAEQVEYAEESYLKETADRLRSMVPDLKFSISTRVIPADDVAKALVTLAEHGKEGPTTSDTGAFGMIALVTHGRSGIKRWVMGSIAERVLLSTKLPFLLVRPQSKK
jgi:nucleotide-binding universal stress UspA family protein